MDMIFGVLLLMLLKSIILQFFSKYSKRSNNLNVKKMLKIQPSLKKRWTVFGPPNYADLIELNKSFLKWSWWTFENCPTLLIVGIPPGLRGIGDFWKSSVRGGLEPIAILGGNGLSKPFVGAFLFVFLDGIAPNQQTSFFLNFSFLFILFTFQLK